MLKEKLITSLFQKPSNLFEEYLKLPENERLIFSGIYGIGKTTFINYFFAYSNQKTKFGYEKYKRVYLSPVNYAVSNNEDIFRYIKFDILYDLIVNHKIILLEEEVHQMGIPNYLFLNINKILAPLLLLVPDHGEDLYEIHNSLFNFFSLFPKSNPSSNKEEVKADKNVDLFFKTILETEGSLYEENIISKIIIKLLDKLKSDIQEEEPINQIETILVIDDLDRIDPHHIFRIFNVFSAHVDSRYEKNNKFGFDKIMFVCDVQNIKNIFQTQYGLNTDFSGYIDKFYSKHIFFYENKNSIYEILDLLLENLNFEGDSQEHTSFYNGSPRIKSELKLLLIDLISFNRINLRSLLKYQHQKLRLHNRKISIETQKVVQNWQVPAVIVVEALNKYFGDYHELDKVLESLPQTYRPENIPKDYEERVSETLSILGYKNHLFQTGNNIIVDFPEFELMITGNFYKIQNFYCTDHETLEFLHRTTEAPKPSSTIRPSMTYLYAKVFRLLKEIDYIK